MKPETTAAALHMCAGVLEKRPDVPPGRHKLDNLEVVFRFPARCGVDRAVGTQGDGYDEGTISEPHLHPHAILLFLEQATKGPALGTHMKQALWLECIRAAERGTRAEPPAEALAALAQWHAAQPPDEPSPVKTQAKRIGTSEVDVVVRRIPKNSAAITKPKSGK